MPIKLPAGLPAGRILAEEGVELLDGGEDRRWGTRPLRIALLNLMPDKQRTELQFARLLGRTPMPVELYLLSTESYTPKNTPAAHISDYYSRWKDIRDANIDGLIVTGAPVAHMAFEDVRYWRELKGILSWARRQVPSALYICWGALAALYHFHGVPKRALAAKMFGVYANRLVDSGASILNGFQGGFWAPTSRYTQIRAADLPANRALKVLAQSSEAGICLIEDPTCRALYMLSHLEYETDTLDAEYRRDLAAGKAIHVPEHYYVDDDPAELPVNRWRLYAHLFFSNWIGDMDQRVRFEAARVA